MKCSSVLGAVEILINMTHLLSSHKAEKYSACVKAVPSVIKPTAWCFFPSKWVRCAVKTPTLSTLSGHLAPL